jgi:hypothetical protein
MAASQNPLIPCAIALIVCCVSVHAQWPRNHRSDVPLSADGRVEVNAPPPRTADGKPDLSGVWRGGGGTFARGQPTGFSYPGPDVAHATSFLIAPFGITQRTDYGEALFKARQVADSRDNPRSHCLPMGIIQLHTSALPARYVQSGSQLVILYEGNMERREIFFDGRRLPGAEAQPWWNGYSVGRWDGDALIVETTNFRDGGWLDMSGNPLTDAAKVTERIRRLTYGRMEIDITIEDRKAYERPLRVRWNQRLAPDDELIEFVCGENNKFPRFR